MTATDQADRVLSNHLIQVLRTYCHGLDPRQLDDLRTSITGGRYPWFIDEFGDAVRTRAFSRADWEATVGSAETRAASARADLVRTEQRVIWSRVLPDQPFPSGSRRSRRDAHPAAGRSAR